LDELEINNCKHMHTRWEITCAANLKILKRICTSLVMLEEVDCLSV
jgi:hypothetical protein